MLIKMSWRNLWRHKIRSILIIASISIGIFAGICVLALYKGMMKSRISNVIYSEVGHIQIHHPKFKEDLLPKYNINNYNTIKKEIEKISKIKSIGCRTVANGMLVTTTGSSGVMIYGIEPENENNISSLDKKVKIGKILNGHNLYDIIIGKRLANKLNLKLKDKIVLTVSDTGNNITSAAFKIKGIYESNNMQLDELNIYINKEKINELLGTENTVNEIIILLKNNESLESVKNKLKRVLPGFNIETWKDISPETQLMVDTVNDYSYIIIIIILTAVSFGIVNTMLMSTLERKKEIGMMIALGASKLKIFILLLFETLLLTISGTPIGFLASLTIINFYEKVGIDFSGSSKEMMASFGFNTMIYPSFPWDKQISIIGMIMALALIASLFPAVKIMQLKPTEALRQ